MTRAAVCALLLSTSLAVQAQFRTGIERVRVDALVSDGNRPVAGLTAADFEVRDNDVVQKIETVTSTKSLSVAILIDVSFSTQDKGKLADLVRAGATLLAALEAPDTVAVLAFSNGVRLLQPSTTDTVAATRVLERAAEQAKKHRLDSTAMWDAVLAASSIAVAGAGRPLVVLLSDGADNASWLFTNQPDDARWIERERERTTRVLRDAGIVVDVLWAPRNLTSDVVDDVYGSLDAAAAAKATQGIDIPATDKALARRVRERLDALRSGYVLSFTPANVTRGDGWHRLSVKLKNRRGRVQARSGYFSGAAPEPASPRAAAMRQMATLCRHPAFRISH